jgi:hypothetical protein
MARNPLQPGEIGRIRTEQVQPGLWRADASYCDHSGTKRRCRKSGRTEATARRAVMDEVEERLELGNPAGLVTATSLVGDAVETYLTNRMNDARNGIGRANRRSVKVYRSRISGRPPPGTQGERFGPRGNRLMSDPSGRSRSTYTPISHSTQPAHTVRSCSSSPNRVGRDVP